MSQPFDIPIPPYVHSRLQEALPRLMREGRRCLLYSAGALTATLLRQNVFKGIRLLGILDQDPARHPEGLEGLSVWHPDRIPEPTPDAILVCSSRFHREIVTSLLARSLELGFEIVDLCAGEPEASPMEGCLEAILQRLGRLEKLHTLQSIAEINRLLSETRFQDHKRLEPFGYKCYSQHDEDGMLAEIFRRLEPNVPRTFVEFGVGDGLENNTLLLLKQGWRGLWLDGSPDYAKTIRQNFNSYMESGQLVFRETFITRDNINDLIGAHFQGNIGLLSLDIDGNDYYVWEYLEVIRPCVVIAEYNGKFPPPLRWSIEYDPEHSWDFSDYQGASLAAMAELGETKGYQLVGCNLNGTNAFFVRNDLVDDRFLVSHDLMDYYHPPRYYLTEGYQWMAGHRADPRPGRFW